MKSFQEILTTFKRLNAIAGVEIWLNSEGIEMSVVIVKRIKGKLQLIDKAFQLTSFKALKDFLPNNIPVAFSIDGKHILNKPLTIKSENPNELLASVLTNANKEDFYWSTYLTDEHSWISISRKTALNKILKEASTEGIQMVEVFLGGFHLQTIKDLIKVQNNEIQSSHHLFRFDKISIQQYENVDPKTEANVSIGGTNYSMKALMAFSAAFQCFVEKTGLSQQIGLLPENREALQYQSLSKKVMMSTLGLLLGLLLFNYFYYSHLFTNVRDQNLALQVNKSQMDELTTLKKQLKEQRVFIGQNNISQHSKTSFYADRIAASRVNGIALKSIDIFPNKKSKSSRKASYQFQSKIILIEGHTQNSLLLNTWLIALKEMEWVNDVRMLPYVEDEKGVGEFAIEVEVK